MRTVGIDLSARCEHKAVIVDQASRFVSPFFRFGTMPASLQKWSYPVFVGQLQAIVVLCQ